MLNVRRGLLICIATLTAACGAQQTAPASSPSGASGQTAPKQQKTLTIGITSQILGFGLAGGNTTAGGWLSATDVHTMGLFTSEAQSRAPVGQLAAKVPSMDDGSIVLEPDGTERVTYTLRKGVTWQDGEPLTAQDLVFSYTLNTDPGLPFVERTATDFMQSAEAPDDSTFVITFKHPYYVATMLGAHFFWPYPKHLLQDAYDKYQQSKDANDILNLSYWTSDYINDGPFRVTDFTPGESVTFKAYDNFFGGKPKLDVVKIQSFGTDNALFSSILAGAVDVYMPVAMSPQLGFELQNQWQAPGNGTVYLVSGNVRFLSPQAKSDYQKEPANLNVQMRKAMYQALDRDAIAAALEGGHSELAAYGYLSPENPTYPAIKDDLRVYAYDLAKAQATLQDAGFSVAPDGSLISVADGHRVQTALWSTSGYDQEIGAIADYWRKLGLTVEEAIIPQSFTRNEEYRATFPGWETTANGDDTILSRFEPPSGPQTHWAGTNRSGWDDPAARILTTAYRSALTADDQTKASKAISEYIVANLPLLPTVYQADHTGVRRGVKALDDAKGGALAGAPYGNFTRDIANWDIAD